MIHTIKLTTECRAIIPLFMKPYDDLKLDKVDFKLDTGADLTTISKKDLLKLGYDSKWIADNSIKDEKHMITSAGGKRVPACYVLIPITNLLGRDFKKWPFYIRAEDNADFPNLLGLNMLSYFDFAFKYSTGYLEIEPAETQAVELPLFGEQEVNEPMVAYK